MSLLEAILLGIVQGLTEFLPVSSSGHLELAKALLGNDLGGSESMLFTIALHAATALSTMLVFRKDILQLLTGLLAFKWNDETRFTTAILVSMIPVFIVGMAFRDEIETLFEGNLMIVGVSLLATAALLFASSRIGKVNEGGEVSLGLALVIGISQAIAILPGLSRSGATISTALMVGVSREKAARFSFLMVLPVIIGAMLLEIKDFAETQPERTVGNTALIAGFLAAFVAGVFACRLMIAIVKKSKLDYFAYYCVAVGILAIVAASFAI